MKVVLSTLILCGTLSVMAGAAVAKQVVPLHCETGTCKFSQELAPYQTTQFDGFCAGKSAAEFSMRCHPVNGMTCTSPHPINPYWTCDCTNWSTGQKANVQIDLYCDN